MSENLLCKSVFSAFRSIITITRLSIVIQPRSISVALLGRFRPQPFNTLLLGTEIIQAGFILRDILVFVLVSFLRT